VFRRDDGDPFDGYTEVERIGGGTFATVHRGVDATTGQPVALKLLNVAAGARFDHEAFDREARALGTLGSHPNIVTLHRASIQTGGQPLLVLELCEGSLADRLASHGPLELREVVSIGVRLAGALETAHRAGILHRDLKPHNVLTTRYDEPALADFGVAELRDAVSGGTPSSGMTVLHAAPEVILGHPATPASDIYALVSTLYELLHGHAPHFVTAGEDPAVVQRRVLDDPAPPVRAPGATLAVRELFARCLDKDPVERPSSALALAQELRAVEDAAGWPRTPCRVEGLHDLPPLSARPTHPPMLGRAAATTGLPPLNLGARPFRSVAPRTPAVDDAVAAATAADPARPLLAGRHVAPLLPSEPAGAVTPRLAPPSPPPPPPPAPPAAQPPDTAPPAAARTPAPTLPPPGAPASGGPAGGQVSGPVAGQLGPRVGAGRDTAGTPADAPPDDAPLWGYDDGTPLHGTVTVLGDGVTERPAPDDGARPRGRFRRRR
jgi:hypothetical protein